MYLTLALIAGFILLYAGFAGRVERSKVSGAMVFTVYGLLVGPSVLGILDLHIDGEVVQTLAELALAVILFVDAAYRRPASCSWVGSARAASRASYSRSS